MPSEPVRRFTVDEYHRLIEIGFFGDEESFELVEGWLLPKMTKKPPHEFALSYLDDFIAARISKKLLRRCQLAITLADSEPEPDLAIVKGPREKYGDQHPHAEDVLLVIEVADVTLRRDRGQKLRAYARAGIPTYWIVNVKARQIEVHSLPQGASYRERVVYSDDQTIELPLGAKRAAELAVSDLFVER
jgi:Uma2 family endonuclease